MSRSHVTRSAATRPIVLVAALALLVLVAACGGSSDGSSSTAGLSATASSSMTAPSAVAASSAGAATSPAPTAAESSPAATGDGGTGTSGAADAQTTKDESSEGSSVLTRFIKAVNGGDAAAASALLAPDAAFQVEDVTNRVLRISPDSPRIRLAPDEEGLPHLALKGTAGVEAVAVDGSDLQSGDYTLAVGLRRESRRDEWRVWSFELQPR